MRSVEVVFPASMCAMIPMFRVSSSLNARPMLPAAFLSPGRIATASLTMAPILVSFFLTSDSGRTPCWLPPCDAHLQRIVAGLFRHLVHRAVKHTLRRALLAIPHHRADKLFHQVVAVNRVGRLDSPRN